MSLSPLTLTQHSIHHDGPPGMKVPLHIIRRQCGCNLPRQSNAALPRRHVLKHAWTMPQPVWRSWYQPHVNSVWELQSRAARAEDFRPINGCVSVHTDRRVISDGSYLSLHSRNLHHRWWHDNISILTVVFHVSLLRSVSFLQLFQRETWAQRWNRVRIIDPWPDPTRPGGIWPGDLTRSLSVVKQILDNGLTAVSVTCQENHFFPQYHQVYILPASPLTRAKNAITSRLRSYEKFPRVYARIKGYWNK